MRTFFALVPDPESCLAIEQWRRQNWPTLTRPVKAANYHITLSFLGEINTRQLHLIEDQLQTYVFQTEYLTLNDTGYWPDNGILWLGCQSAPATLGKLAALCARTANRAGIKVSKRTYHPHLTLARRVATPPPSPLVKPEFDIVCERLCLLQSLFDNGAVRYSDVRQW